MRKRILIVDDDPDILESLRMLLEESYEVEVALDGERALAEILAKPFDAIVLDLMMPVLDGAAFLRELRARGVPVPVVLVSAARDLTARARALDIAEHLSKPFDPALLEDKLARLTGQGGATFGSG